MGMARSHVSTQHRPSIRRACTPSPLCSDGAHWNGTVRFRPTLSRRSRKKAALPPSSCSCAMLSSTTCGQRGSSAVVEYVPSLHLASRCSTYRPKQRCRACACPIAAAGHQADFHRHCKSHSTTHLLRGAQQLDWHFGCHHCLSQRCGIAGCGVGSASWGAARPHRGSQAVHCTQAALQERSEDEVQAIGEWRVGSSRRRQKAWRTAKRLLPLQRRPTDQMAQPQPPAPPQPPQSPQGWPHSRPCRCGSAAGAACGAASPMRAESAARQPAAHKTQAAHCSQYDAVLLVLAAARQCGSESAGIAAASPMAPQWQAAHAALAHINP